MQPRRSHPTLPRASEAGPGTSAGVRLGRAVVSRLAVDAGRVPLADGLGRDVLPATDAGLAAAATGQPRAGVAPWAARGARRYVRAADARDVGQAGERAAVAAVAVVVPNVVSAAVMAAERDLAQSARHAYERALSARLARPVLGAVAAQVAVGPVVAPPSLAAERATEARNPLQATLALAGAARARLAWLLALLAPAAPKARAMPAGELDGPGQVRRRAVAPSAPQGTRGGYVPSLTDHLRSRTPVRAPLVQPTVPALGPSAGQRQQSQSALCAPSQ